MYRRIFLAVIAAAMLTGCSEKRVDGPTAPSEAVSPETTMATTGMTEAVVTQSETVPVETEGVSETESVPVSENTSEGRKHITLETLMEPRDSDFVLVTDYLSDIQVELRYAGPDNFTGKTIYAFSDAFLRYGTVKKLELVCEELKEQGLYLKIWDAFRPHQAQHTLWEVCPDPQYVANPERGYSAHTRGNTLDLTLVDEQGREVEMPTGFDDFSAAADRDYSDCTEQARDNAMLLQTVMEKHGFRGYWGEWWHFTDHTQYDPEKVFDPADFAVWTPDCDEYITLRSKPDAKSEPVNRIALGEEFVVLGFTGRFAMAQYQGQRGYVLYNYIKPVE